MERNTLLGTLTTEPFAVSFYEHCGFTANEVKKPYKDTIRMYMTLYAKDEELADDEG